MSLKSNKSTKDSWLSNCYDNENYLKSKIYDWNDSKATVYCYKTGGTEKNLNNRSLEIPEPQSRVTK